MTLNSISVTNGVTLSKCIGTATSAGNENQIILFSNSAYAKVYIRFCFLIIVIISASSNNDSLNHSLTKHILLLNNSKINTIFDSRYTKNEVRLLYYPRLRDLREDHDMVQKEVAAFLGIDQRVYSNYETGKREIPTRFVVSLARLYNTSTDYILGMTDEIKPYI